MLSACIHDVPLVSTWCRWLAISASSNIISRDRPSPNPLMINLELEISGKKPQFVVSFLILNLNVMMANDRWVCCMNEKNWARWPNRRRIGWGGITVKHPQRCPPLSRTPFLLSQFSSSSLLWSDPLIRRSHVQNSSVTVSMIAVIKQGYVLFVLNLCSYVHSQGNKVRK